MDQCSIFDYKIFYFDLLREQKLLGLVLIQYQNYLMQHFHQMVKILIQFLMHLEKLLSMDQLIQVFYFIFSFFQIFFSFHLDDDGIARSNDALTLLENRSTYTLFIHELYRVC